MEEHDPQTHAIIGAAFKVHATLGHGFLESVYQEAMTIELSKSGIPYQLEVPLPIYYLGTKLKKVFCADLICYGEVVVELKALSALTGKDLAQCLNYLKATKLKRCLLLNFGTPSLKPERIVLDY